MPRKRRWSCNHKWELYILKQDRTEMNDLSQQHPEKVTQLQALYEAWAQRCNVMPWGELKEHCQKSEKKKK